MPVGEPGQAQPAVPESASEPLNEIPLERRAAHDFNNVLQVISGNLDLAMRLIEHPSIGDERVRAQLVAAIARAQRSTEKLAAAFHRTVDAG